MNEKQIKLYTTVIAVCSLLVILVLMIDLDTKRRLLAAAESLKETINDGRIQAANHKGSGPDVDYDGTISPDLVDNGNARVATAASNGGPKRSTSARKSANRPGGGDSNSGLPAVNE